MNTRKRRGILALMVSLVMVFSSFSLVFADEYGRGEDMQDYLPQKMQGVAATGFGGEIVPAGGLPIQSNRISAGVYYSLAIMPDNSLWGWGVNWIGQLGDGINENRFSPVWIMDDVAAVSAGINHVMAIRTDGSLWGWGCNRFGQLGNGITTGMGIPNPTPVKIMDNVSVVSAGASHTMAITTDGSLWAWGANESGQLGDGTSTDRHSPVWIANGVIAVSAGSWHTMAITADGSLWGWGANWNGHLGDGTTTSQYSPVWIAGGVAAVSAGADHTMAITTDGNLFGWGANWAGQIGDGTIIERHSPVWIMDDVVKVSANGHDIGGHTMAIRADGSLWGWGHNSHGQLGSGTVCDWGTPNFNPLRIMENVAEVSTGMDHTIAISIDGCFWAWGSNRFGQLGDGTDVDSYSPVLIKCHTPTGNNTPDPNKNLTYYYATMTASSSFNPINTPPHHTNDNNITANVWRPAAPGTGYLTARFDEAKNFNQIRVYQNGNRIQNYQLKYSNDGAAWNVLHSGAATPAAISTYPLGATVTAQYVRLVIGQSLNANPAAVLQFDIRYMP